MIIQEAKDPNLSKQRIESLLESLRSKRHITVTIEVCSLCNLKCKFCDLHSGRFKDVEHNKGLMTEVRYKEIIDSIADLGYKLKVVHFQGNGEPLMHNKFSEMVRYAYDKNISEKYVLATNGVLMNNKTFDKLLECGLDEIHVSLDTADPEKYLEFKGRDFSRKVLENIDYAMKRVTEQKRMKFFIKIPVPTPNGDYGINKEDMEKAILRFKDLENQYVNIKLMPIELYNDGCVLKRKSSSLPCEQVFYLAYIKFDGRVSICCVDIYDNLNIGRIPEQSMSEILNGNALRQIRKIHIENRVAEISQCYYCGARPEIDLTSHAEEIKKYI